MRKADTVFATIRSLLVCATVVIGASASSTFAAPLPKGVVEVRPVNRQATSQAPAAQLTIGATPFFNYVLPQGWRIGESGQYALTLIAPDNHALTIMVGNSGLPIDTSPAQFLYQKLMAIRPQTLQLGQPRQARPIQGFSHAWEFPVMYTVNGNPCLGLATVHVAPAYDSAVMAVTAALSQAPQWQGYSNWLPLVASQVSARNGAAFGMRGIMAQNLQNSTEYARAAQEYRNWSQQNWQAVADQRNASQDRNNRQFRETLGNVQTYVNPHDSQRPVELPNTYKYFWVNEQGTIVGTNDAGIDMNSGSTHDWQRMPKRAQ